MKKAAILLWLFSSTFVKAQNLVPNESFEQFTSCPTNLGQTDSALFWINPTTNSPGISGSSDYFNQCSTIIATGVPDNNFGYQPAHTGGAYCGIIAWYGGPSPDYREYIEVPLTSSLIPNQCYHFEMYVCLAERSDHATDALQVYLSNTLISGVNNYLPLPYTPQIINTSGMITDTLNWTLVSGNYTASGGESHLIIGNFKYDATTTTQPTGFGFFQEAYYYIDDVSLTPCTGINIPNLQNLEYLIYPNPVKELLVIRFSPGRYRDGKTEIIIRDILGKEIYRSKPQTLNLKQGTQIDVSKLTSAAYFIEIQDGKNISRKKFLKSTP